MGMDIHVSVERKTENGYEPITDAVFTEGREPFDWRYYGMFGFLCGEARNWSAIAPLVAEARGVPADASTTVRDRMDGYHTLSWVSVEELVKFDYEQMLEDRRGTVQVAPNLWNGGATLDEGQGQKMTYREFLGEAFLRDVRILEEIGADRIIFGFDS